MQDSSNFKISPSQSYHLRIDGARQAGFFRALHNGAAVFEDSNFIRRGGTLQEKFVELDGSEHADGFGQFGEIEVTFHSWNELDGVAAAERDGPQRVAIQVFECTFRAHRTRGHGFRS